MQTNFDVFERRAVATAARTSLARAARTARPARRGQRTKTIEDIQIGDLVWAWDEAQSQPVRRPVVRLFRHQGKPTLTVTVVDDDGIQQRIECTTEHPFWVEGKGWVAACELATGDLLKRIAAGADLRVASSLLTGVKADVFNFEVAGVHNYFVGRWGVLVHNQSGFTADDVAPGTVRMKPRLQDTEQTKVALLMIDRYVQLAGDSNREFGGLILQHPNGKVYPTEARIGLPAEIYSGGKGNYLVAPPGHEVIAAWHIHPGRHPAHLQFSQADFDFADSQGMDLYVGLQDGRSLLYHVASRGVVEVARNPARRVPSDQHFFAEPDRPILELLGIDVEAQLPNPKSDHGIGIEASLPMSQPASPSKTSPAPLRDLYLGDPALVGEPRPMRLITPPPVRWQGGKLTLPSEVKRVGEWIGNAEPAPAFDVPQRFVPTKAPPPPAPESSRFSDPDYNPFNFD